MRKFRNAVTDTIITENDLLCEYARQIDENAGIIDFIVDFPDFINHCLLVNGGDLEEIAPDWMIERLRRAVANDLACKEMEYSDILEYFQSAGIFGTWTVYEINNRPVDLEEIRELAEENLIGY